MVKPWWVLWSVVALGCATPRAQSGGARPFQGLHIDPKVTLIDGLQANTSELRERLAERAKSAPTLPIQFEGQVPLQDLTRALLLATKTGFQFALVTTGAGVTRIPLLRPAPREHRPWLVAEVVEDGFILTRMPVAAGAPDARERTGLEAGAASLAAAKAWLERVCWHCGTVFLLSRAVTARQAMIEVARLNELFPETGGPALIVVHSTGASPVETRFEAAPLEFQTPPQQGTPTPSADEPSADNAARMRGRLPPEAIQRVARSSFQSFRECYEQGLARNPTLEGAVVTRFVIERDGRVRDAQEESSTLPDPAVVKCIVEAFSTMQFPAPEGGIVTVVYPLWLAASNDPPGGTDGMNVAVATSLSAAGASLGRCWDPLRTAEGTRAGHVSLRLDIDSYGQLVELVLGQVAATPAISDCITALLRVTPLPPPPLAGRHSMSLTIRSND